MSEFARGARVKLKQQQAPISEEISIPEFFAMMGIYVVRDYKIRDREAFLRWCGNAFDAALRSIPP